MKLAKTICFRNGALKRSVAGLSLLLWLNVLALAALPQLHTHVHADAHSPTHQCAVTAVEQGKFVSTAPAPVMVAAAPTFELETAFPISVSLPAIALRLAPGRAPPTA
jgi:ABC-type phosphate transport system substrate-binding protein